MATESGFSNKSMQGRSNHKTLQNLGSSRVGSPAANMGLFEKTPLPIAILSVTRINSSKDGSDQRILRIQFDGPHLALKWDILRFITGGLANWEFEIFRIINGTTLDVFNIGNVANAELIPQIGETAKTLRWVTAKFGEDGGIQTTSGPVQFVRNGTATPVNEDTAVPANNRALPTELFIMKDGVQRPVTKDTGTPANTVAIPVELVQASGTNINITAGDLNVQTSAEGANFDSQRIGDGTGKYAGITTDLSLMVKDADLIAAVNTGNTAQATAAKQDVGNGSLATINTKIQTVSTEAKQDVGNASLASIDTKVTGLATSANQTTMVTALGGLTETAPATDTASSGLNGRLQRIAQRLTSLIALLPASLGQKTSALSLAVTIASDQSAVLTSTRKPAVTTKQAAITVGVAAIRLTTDAAVPSATRQKLMFMVDPNATGNLFVGSSTVTASGATRGVPVFPGQNIDWTDDANDYYIISDTAGQTVFVVEAE